jgi:hypothetical protein
MWSFEEYHLLGYDAVQSETSVETQRTTRRHIPEDDTLHNYRCENLKSMSYLYLSNNNAHASFHLSSYNNSPTAMKLKKSLYCTNAFPLMKALIWIQI